MKLDRKVIAEISKEVGFLKNLEGFDFQKSKQRIISLLESLDDKEIESDDAMKREIKKVSLITGLRDDAAEKLHKQMLRLEDLAARTHDKVEDIIWDSDIEWDNEQVAELFSDFILVFLKDTHTLSLDKDEGDYQYNDEEREFLKGVIANMLFTLSPHGKERMDEIKRLKDSFDDDVFGGR